MTQPTTREARTQFILIVVAIAAAGIVFALTGDFVIGVGIGAAIFALGRQALRIWGHNSDHEADTASEPDREPIRR